MEKENGGKGKGFVANLIEILFENGYTASTIKCMELLCGQPDEKVLQQALELCMAISARKDEKLITEAGQVEAISSIVQATFFAYKPQPELCLLWLEMIAAPIIKQADLKISLKQDKLESFAYGVIIGMFQYLNLHVYPRNPDDKLELDQKLEQAFADIVSNLISRPSTVMFTITPDNQQRAELNEAIQKYVKPYNYWIGYQRKAIIYSLLQQVRQNLPNKDPWGIGGSMINYHLSKLILEKLLYAIWGSFTMIEMLDYILQGGLRYDSEASSELTSALSESDKDDPTGLSTEFKKELKPTDEFPTVGGGRFKTHYDLGIAYKEMGLIEDAISEFLCAAQTSMDKHQRIDSLLMISNCYREKGEFDSALPQLLHALDLNPDDKEKTALYWELAQVYQAKGELDSAISRLNQALALEMNSRFKSVLWFELAQIYWSKGVLDLAQDGVNKSLEFNPNFEKAKKLLAEIEVCR